MLLRVLLSVPAVFLFVAARAGSAEDRPAASPAEEARKDLQQMQGTWRLESLEQGKKSGGKVDVKKRTLFIGGELFLVRDGDRVVQAGVARLAAGKTPRRIDVAVRKAPGEDATMLGIYELKGDTLKVCFDPEGDGRPDKFAAKADSAQFVAVYKRVKPAGETIDIRGKYLSESLGADGKKQTLSATVEKRGDAYLVRWSVPGGLAYLGMGIRQGNTLSVAWANRGSIGVSVYRIEKGPKLVGVYTEVGGPGVIAGEQLVPDNKDRVEVRAR